MSDVIDEGFLDFQLDFLIHWVGKNTRDTIKRLLKFIEVNRGSPGNINLVKNIKEVIRLFLLTEYKSIHGEVEFREEELEYVATAGNWVLRRDKS